MASELSELSGELTGSADALLLGRVTYEGFAASWPTRDESDPATGAAFVNNVKKWVASRTLTDPKWRNSEVLPDDLVEAVTALKAQEGEDLLQYGCGEVTAQLVEAGLVDEVHLWIHPVLRGGPSLSVPAASFELIGTRVFNSGVIVASYRPGTGA